MICPVERPLRGRLRPREQLHGLRMLKNRETAGRWRVEPGRGGGDFIALGRGQADPPMPYTRITGAPDSVCSPSNSRKTDLKNTAPPTFPSREAFIVLSEF